MNVPRGTSGKPGQANAPQPVELQWDSLLNPYLACPLSTLLRSNLSAFLALLIRWNARTNLTSLHDPTQIVQRHLGESLFAADQVPRGTLTLLDHGTGAGFPGIPIALVHPHIAVTLSESQNKKTAFLRECLRTLPLPNVTIHAGRTEELPSATLYDVVTMRAVDDANVAYPAAFARVRPRGHLLAMEGQTRWPQAVPESETPIPGSHGLIRIYRNL